MRILSHMTVSMIVVVGLVMALSSGTTTLAQECPDGYEAGHNGHCYHFQGDSMAFNDARIHCLTTNDSDLVIIDTQGELDYLLNKTTGSADWLWIGFFDVSVEGTWKWVNCEDPNEWQDDLWADGEPANDAMDCAALVHTNGSIIDDDCSRPRPFICEVTPKGFSRDEANAANPAAVPISWSATNVTWDVSDVNCDVTAYNVTYTSRTSNITTVTTVYGGDATGVTLEDLEVGVIYDISVASIQMEKELAQVGPIQVCPYFYEESPSGICYYFSTGTTTYQGARSSCLSDPDGDLLIISDQSELDYVLQRLSNNENPTWIGYFDRASEGQWTWADCQSSTPWQESLWAPEQPTGYDEDCGALESTGMLSDYVCDRYYRYICEISPKGFSRDEANVKNVTAVPRRKDAVTISWTVSDVNCDVYGYTIRLTDVVTQSIEFYYAHGGDTDTFVADGLKQDTSYQVTVTGLQIDRQLPEVGFVTITTGCPDGYYTSGSGDCYYFSSNETTFDSARRKCLSDPDGDLVIIDTQDELDYLLNETAKMGLNQNWWIGLFDASVEGSWKWANCQTPNDWQNGLWADGEPDKETEDCGTLSDKDGTLSADDCDIVQPYICEITVKGFSQDDANVQNVEAVPISVTKTNITWEVSEVNCDVIGYNIYYTPRTSGIEKVKNVNGGDVDRITLEELEEYVIYDISVAAVQTDRVLPAVGPIAVCPYLFDTGPSGNCYYFSSGTTSYEWARYSCLSDHDGDLVIINDQEELDYITEMTSTDDVPRWIGYFDRAEEGQWTWANCESSNQWQESLWAVGEPTGYDEDCAALDPSDHLSDYVCDQSFRYICEISPKGFSRDDANAYDVTATQRTQDTITVRWKVSEVNCDVYGYTIRVTDMETQIMEVYYAHGGHTDRIVADSLKMATTYQVTVSGLQIERQLPQVGFVNVTTGCPNGYETSPSGGCYYFSGYGYDRRFDVARRNCLSDPEGDLVIIDSQEELDYLMDEMSQMMPNQSFWIGFFDISVEGSWTWADCQAATKWHNSLWADGEPGNGIEDCGSIFAVNGTLADNVCDVSLPFICELTTKEFSRDEANVQNVAAVPISETETNVTWDVSMFNCDVFGYNVYYTPRTSGIRYVQTVYGGDVDGTTLTGLEEYVIYDIGVAALQFDRELPEVKISVCPYTYDTSPTGSCYYFSRGTATYERARNFCLYDPDGDLTIINDQEELDYLVGMTSGDDLPRWIGYFDRATEGQWTWANCQNSNPWQESLWAVGEPTGYDEDCAALDLNDHLSDYACDQYFGFICELSPKGFSRVDANAYDVTAVQRTQSSIIVNWKVSEVNCDVYGYTVRVTDIETQYVEVYYAHGGETDSIVADGLKMATTYQVTVAGLQIERQLPQVGFVNVTTGCPNGYQTSPSGGCYYFSGYDRRFDSARRNCLSDPEGDLVIIDSQEELEYLVDEMSQMMPNQSFWIGFFDISVEGSWTWADCQVATEWHKGLWADGEPGNGIEDCGSIFAGNGTLADNVCDDSLPFICEITIKEFSRDEANVQNVAAVPISVTETNVTWDVSMFNCDIFGYNVYYTPRTSGIRYVQTVYGGDVNGTTLMGLEEYVIYDIGVAALQFDRELPEVRISVCPYTYDTSPSGSCYYFSSGTASYEWARYSCLYDPDGDLAIINDQEELDYLIGMTSGDDVPRWIGYFDRATEGQWTWANCESSNPWQESLWAVGEPTGYDEDCAALDLSDHLSDYVCDQSFRYICEISPKGFSRDDANAIDVTATPRNQNSVTVRWKISEVNCDVYGYTIRVTDVETQSVKVYYAHGGDTTALVADGLQASTTYQVTVAGLQIDRQLPQVGYVNVTTGCPDGYQMSPSGGCYYFFKEGRTFDWARGSCLSDPDGDLVIIDSQEELDYLKSTASAMLPNGNWWIGFFDISVEGSWTWADCQATNEWYNSLWATGEPSNELEDCGSFSSDDGTLLGNLCDAFLPYICEITVKGFSRDEANVQNVAASPISPTVITVTWDVAMVNCDVFGYNVYYTLRTSGMRSVVTVYGGDVDRVTLTELEEYAIYDISVAALQTDRELPEVGPISVCPYLYDTGPSGSCYYFSRGTTTYEYARPSCLSDPDGDLVIINDKEELDYLVDMTSRDVVPRWIGYFDRAMEGQWTWADCQSPNAWQESLWAEDEPDGYDEDCGALDPDDQLSDYVCDRNFRYICEISPKGFSRDEANAYNVTATARTQTSITVRWQVSDVNCDVYGYTIRVTDVTGGFPKAHYAHGGNTDSIVADGLKMMTTYTVTVAGLQIDRQLPQVGYVNVSTGCPDGYETSPDGGCYYFFSDEARTFSSARSTCLSGPDSDLVIIDSQEELNYLTATASSLIPDGNWWIGFFDISVEGSWKWADCQAATEWHNGLWAVGEPDNGLKDCGSLNGTDGTLSGNVCDVFLPFICEITAKGFSRDDANVQNVAAIPISETETNVTWDVSDFNCDVFGYNVYYTSMSSGKNFVATVYGGDVNGVTLEDMEAGVIFEISVAALQTDKELPKIGPVTVCPYSYEMGPSDVCYWFSGGESTYEWARYSCLYYPDEDLVIIDNQEELDYLLDRISEYNQTSWIGYFDRATEGEWTWADCQASTPWQENQWGVSEPSGYDEDCGALETDGFLSDYVCDRSFRYICEKAVKGFSRDDANAYGVTASPRTPTSITINWKVSEVNCDVYGYTIRVTNFETGAVHVYYAHGGETSALAAGGLEKNVLYVVTIAGLQIDRQLPQVGFVNVTTGCPEGYETSPFGGCYYFAEIERMFDYARRSCLSDPGGDLVIIDTQQELDYLLEASSMTMPKQMWWIGYFDISVEGSWKWTDCQAANEWHITLWADGEPDNGLEDCGSLNNTEGTISDNVCDVFLPFICEITDKGFSRDDANAQNVAAVAASETEIKVTWDVSPVNCDVFGYNVYYTSRSSGMRHVKTVYGGDVNGTTLMDLVVGVIYDVSVAALQFDRELPEIGPIPVCPYYFEESPSGGCYYFSFGDTSYQGARSSCLYGPDGDLVIINDQQELDYLVERANGSRWIGYFDRATEGYWTWANCQSSDPWQESLWAENEPTGYDEDCGVLETTGLVSDYICDQDFKYICEISPPRGFSRDDANAKDVAVVSLSITKVNVTWTTSEVNCDVYGYTVRVTNTITDEISFYYAHGGATSSIVVDGLIPGTSYQVTVAGLQIDRELPQVGFVDITTDCPGTLQAAPIGGCYSFSSNTFNFNTWRLECQDVQGGDLVIISDEEELSYLQSMASQLNIDEFWLSFFDFGVEGDWRWGTCEAPTTWQEALWGPGEPGNGQEDCGILNAVDGHIESVVCEQVYPAICEYNPRDFTIDDTNVNNVSATTTGFYSILVEWEVSPVGCEVYGFQIYFYPESDQTDEGLASVSGGDVTSYELQGLLSSTAYTIYVAALHQYDELDKVGPAVATTEDLPACEPQELTEASGVIESPDFPEQYPPNQDCSWYISLPEEANVVRLVFEEFSLENGADYLYVGEGTVLNENVLATLTGNEVPNDIRATTYQVWLRFTSNEEISSSGFRIQYSSIATTPLETRQQQSVIIRVFNQGESWFDENNRLKLSEAVSQALNEYCDDNPNNCYENQASSARVGRRLLATDYQPEDVEFVKVEESGADLEVYTWVWESLAPQGGVEQDVLTAALEENADTVTRVMDDPEFEFETDIPDIKPEDPNQGLEAWSISLIIASCVLVLIVIVGYIELKARQKAIKYTHEDIDEVDSLPPNNTNVSPTHAEEGKVSSSSESTSPPRQEETPDDATTDKTSITTGDDQAPDKPQENNGTAMNDPNGSTEEAPAGVEEISLNGEEDHPGDHGIDNPGFENEADEVTPL